METVVVPGIVAVVLAGVDLLVLGRESVDGMMIAHVMAVHALVAVLAAPALLAAVLLARWGRRWPVESPAHPALLIAFAGLGGLVMWLNRETFEGEGLQRSGWARPAEALAIAGALTALFLAVRYHVLACARRAAGGRRPWGWMSALAAIGIGATLADRGLFRGQYPQLHVQLWGVAWAAGIGLVGLTWSYRRPRPIRAIAALVVVAAASNVLLPRLAGSSAALARLASARNVAATRSLDVVGGLLAPLLPELVPDDVDGAAFLRADPVDTAALAAARAPLGERPNLIVFTIDTVRFDHVGFLGYDRHPTTAAWDELAAESATFTNAYTAYPTSHWAFSSMFTSTWPGECPQRAKHLPHPTDLDLASQLRRAGYTTAALTSFEPPHVVAGASFDTLPRGFDEFRTMGIAGRQADAGPIVDAAEDVVSRLKAAGAPFFLWVHVFDPHDNYVTRTGFDFGTRDVDRYDSEIAWADAAMGRLIGHLKSEELWDRTVFVAHSDHGEAFGEHGTQFHHSSVFEEQVHIPLTIRIPHVAGRRLEETVSLVDLVPTLTTLLGVDDAWRARRRGRDLAPLLLGLREDGDARHFAFCQLLLEFFPSGKKHALVKDGVKVIVTPAGFPRWQVYDLGNDPREERSVFGERPDRDRKLMGLLEYLRRAAGGDG